MINMKKIKFFVIGMFFVMSNFYSSNALESSLFDDLEMVMYLHQSNDDDINLLFELMEDIDKKHDEKSMNSNLSNNDIVNLGLTYIGKRYRYGASGPDEFDCSGFVLHFFNALGKSVPRTSEEQSKFGVSVARGNLRVGDVIFFDTRNSSNSSDIKVDKEDVVTVDLKNYKITHSGIYIGDGKFIHASSGSIMKIVIDDLNSKYFNERYVLAKRFL